MATSLVTRRDQRIQAPVERIKECLADQEVLVDGVVERWHLPEHYPALRPLVG